MNKIKIILLTLLLLPTSMLLNIPTISAVNYESMESFKERFPSYPDEEPLYGGTLRIAINGDVISFNTILNYWFRTTTYDVNVYDRLLVYDENWVLQPQLASYWEIYENGKKHIYYLRDDVKWHDGEPFTSADVKWHFENVANGWPEPCLSTAKFTELDTIETPGEYTVVFNFKQPTLPDIFAYGQAGVLILPKHIYDGDTAEEFKSNPANWAPVGTGPFKVTEYEKDQYIVMEANEDYFLGRPYYDKLEWRVITDEQIAILSLENDEIDYVTRGMPSGANIQVVRDNPDLGFMAIPATRVYRIMFNMREGAQENFPWLKDRNVRVAMGHAIDRDTIIEDVAYNTWFKTSTAMSPGLSEIYNFEIDAKYPDYDPEEAERLLDEAGFPRGSDGVRFRCKMLCGTPTDLAEILQFYLKQVGIEVELFPVEYATYVSEYLNGEEGMTDDYPIALQTTGVGPEADNRLNYHSDRSIGVMNMNFYNDDRVDELVIDIVNEADPATRKELIMEFQEVVFEDFPEFFLWADSRRWAWRKEEFMGYLDHPKPVYVLDAIGRGGWWKGGEPLITEPEPEPEPTDGELETRVTEMESDLKDVSSQLSSMDNKIGQMESKIDEISMMEAPSTNNTLVYVSLLLAVVAIAVSLYIYTKSS
jgi:peptide/nickel transport system substrate-binding protein